MKYENVKNLIIVTVIYTSIESGNIDSGYFYSFIDDELEEHSNINMDGVIEVLEVIAIDETCNVEIDDDGYVNPYIDNKERVYNADEIYDTLYYPNDRYVLYPPIHHYFTGTECCVRFLRQRGLI